MKEICILIPVYNEEESLPFLYDRLSQIRDRLHQYGFYFLFIDDGSKDDTVRVIQELQERDDAVQYVSLSRNYGKEVAMMAGFDYTNGDAVILLDADLQDPPELIPQMLKYWEQGYKDVYAKRVSRDGESWFKKWSSKTYYRFLQKMTSIDIQEDTGDFRLLDKTCIEALKQMRESQRYTKGMFSWMGFKKKEILFHRDARVAGETKWSYKKLFGLAMEGLTSLSIAPLRIATIIGSLAIVAAVVLSAYLVIHLLVSGAGMTSMPLIIDALLLMGGIQLLCTGLLGEYVGRIFMETKERPLYFVESSSIKPRRVLLSQSKFTERRKI
ncbi:glycosyltransferase family 2 protein [Listeria booriae]|uniref:Glycosyltransferase family 2 protein n=1 Tax=Listeria booriae TaxID=1552123 RepID=A0A7X1CI50_9LIST|nr:glycosyltransferase family 2 protein [Listeria booriae]MBC1778646.1 glycosyltransferase family 2 protein [Listeria booriae]MBC1917196.1 glycosyltransferase family 2 protein [Listeria booriae]MBC2106287.1 glycosyltransferase family 2 protein [Listeria booriae]MBC2205748.1 glycosyltransferase family 2 protein [Listeria booriae]